MQAEVVLKLFLLLSLFFTKKVNQAYRAFICTLLKAFKIDVTICDHCNGKLKKVYAVNDGHSIRRYLRHLSIDPDPSHRIPARAEAFEFDFDQGHIEQTEARSNIAAYDKGLPVIHID